MVIAYIPFVFALIGLLLYLLAARPETKDIGRILFFCGTLATLLSLASKTFRIG